MDDPTFDRSDESLLYAFSCLLNRLSVPIDFNQLRQELAGQDLNFESLADGEHVHIVEKGDYGSWPTSNDAIIKFQYQDQDEPYIELENGQRDANIVDHYCIVADHEQRTIIDSATGVVKEGSQFGHPVSWAMFEAGIAPAATAAKVDEERSYKVLKGGESGWQIARKLGVDANELKEHNLDDFEDFGKIPEGTVLHLPTRLEIREKAPTTEFEFLRRPLEMHVSKPGGTRKYSFGNAKKAEDIKETGPRAAENKNVMIFAIAHVPIGDETYGYYMESSDIDQARKKIKWTVGFNHSHLAEGHLDPNEPAPSPQVQEIIQTKLDEAATRRAAIEADQAAEAQRLAMLEDVEAEDNPPSRRQGSDSLPLEDPEYSHNWWKTTFKPLNQDRKPDVYLFNNDTVVSDLDGKLQNKLLRKLDGVRIAGDFTGPDNKEYWRPQDAMDLHSWYGIPKLDPETGDEVLISEVELYNTNLPLAERATMRHGRLSKVERYFTVPLAKATARSPWLRRYADKAKQNKE